MAAISTHNAKEAAEFERKIQSVVGVLNEELLTDTRMLAKITIDQALRYTPPNSPKQGGTSFKNKNSTGIKTLKVRIAADILGASAVNENGTLKEDAPEATVFKVGNEWSYRDVSKSASDFNPKFFLIPRASSSRRKGSNPPILKNKKSFLSWYESNSRIVKGKKAMWRRREGDVSKPVYIGKGVLNGAIKELQKRAGFLLSGWSKPSAKVNKGKATAGTHPDKNGDGSLRVFRDGKGKVSFEAMNNAGIGYLGYIYNNFQGDDLSTAALLAFGRYKRTITAKVHNIINQKLK